MNRRILAAILTCYIAGVTISAFAGNGIYVLLASLLLAVVMRSFSSGRRGFMIGVCVIAAFTVGSVWFTAHRLHADQFESFFCDQKVRVYGIVDENMAYKDGRHTVTLRQKRISLDHVEYDADGRIIVIVQDAVEASLGDRMIVSGTLLKAPAASNSNGFDYNLYLRTQDTRGRMYVNAVDICPLGQERNLFYRIRLFGNLMKDRLGQFTGGEAGALLNGITFGDVSGFSGELKTSFARSGISHIVAVSGMNVTILIAFIMYITGKVGSRRKLRGLLCLLGVVVYMLITGLSPSVLRAGVMGVMMLAAILLDKKEDFFTSFILSAALILMINPYSIYNVSFLLSFAATAGIIIFTRPFIRILLKIMPLFLAEIIATSAAAIIATAPVTAAVFNTFSVVALITNILVVPYAEILFIGCFAALLFGIRFFIVGRLLGAVLVYFANVIIWVSNAMSALPFAVATVATPQLTDLICYGILLYFLYALVYKRKPRPLTVTLAALTFACCVGLNLYTGMDFRVEFINVGQGDSILISAPGRQNYLIDTGNMNTRDLVQYLQSRGIRNLKAVFLTHADQDHSGGIEAVIGAVKVEKVVMPGIRLGSAQAAERKNTVLSLGVDVEFADRPDTYALGKGMVAVLWPGETPVEQSPDNNNCLVMRLDYLGHSFLFTGDLEQAGEKLLQESGEMLDTDVLKVSHHGSKYATSQSFINQVTPEISVISVGKNRYGHPDGEIISRLECSGSDIYRTDLNGNVIFTIRPDGHMNVNAFR